MGYCLNRLDEPVFMARPEPMLTVFGIHQRLESSVWRNGGSIELSQIKDSTDTGILFQTKITEVKFKLQS